MTSRDILTVVLLVSATVAAAPEGGVSFWMDKVKLTCPENGEWFKVNGKNVEKLHEGSMKTEYEYTYTGSKDHYHCKYQGKIYSFFIQGKACKKCFELDGLVLVGVIVGDVIGTVIVMLVVYKCTQKKKTKAAASPRAAKPARGREEIPMNSDYAPLSVHNRSQDYSVINRTG